MPHIIERMEKTPSRSSQQRDDEADFELLVASVRDYAIFMLDPTGRVVTWNLGAERIHGYAAAEIRGQHFSVFSPRMDAERGKCDTALAIAVREGRYEEEGARVRKDGSQFWASVVITALHDPSGHLVGFAKVTRDLTERRAAQEALRESEERFRYLVGNVKDYAIVMLDRSGSVVSWNSGAEHLKGWRAEEIIRSDVSRFFTEDDVRVGKPHALLAAAADSGRVEDESWRMRKDGSRFWASVIITAVRDSAGVLRGFGEVTRDLTEQRRAQDEIELRTRQQAAIAELGLFALRTRHLQEVLDHAVASVAGTLGLDCVDFLEVESGQRGYRLRAGVGWLEDLMGNSVLPAAPNGQMAFVIAHGQPVVIDDMATEGRFTPSPIHRHRGIVSSVLLVVPAVPGPGGANERPYGVLGAHATRPRSFSTHELDFLRAIANTVGSAISRQSSERELRAAQERAESARLLHAAAEQASRAKDEFLALLGHELRNPLAPIVTALELLHLRGESEGREVEIIERHVQHLTRLVDDLLDVSRVVRGKLELHPEPHELATVAKKGVEMASPLLEQRRQQFTLDVAASGLSVLGDEARLAQVVSNLLTNAAKYTPPGGHISLSARSDDSFVVLTVKDTGIGISAELLPHIFDVFIQGPRTADRAEGGLGLGLTLVKRIVALHGGTVSARSAGAGHGSEFVVRLPRLPHDVAPRGEPQEAERLLSARRPRRILIVDDNADAAETLAAVLEAVGHEVRTAADALQALRTAAAHRPEIAILDIGLPVVDGYELARRLRQRLGEPLLIYAVTGYGQDSDRAKALAAGFGRHFVKPVETEALLRAIEED